MNAPCKDCPKRHPSCHATCPDYLEYVEDRKRIAKAKFEYSALDPLNKKAFRLKRRGKR